VTRRDEPTGSRAEPPTSRQGRRQDQAPSRQDAERYRAAILERSRTCAGATDVGPVRERNEDAYWISDEGTVLVVADGLGGLPAGDVASAIAVSAIEDLCGRELAPSQAGNRESLLRAAAELAQQRVLDAGMARAALHGMATTIVVAFVDDDAVSILHVGDSRAALWRRGSFVQTTYDHNGVGDLVRAGTITFDEARHYPGRNLVREVLGLGDGYAPELQRWPLEPGDIVLLCTDGIAESLDDAAVARILESAPSAAAAAATLVALAGAQGGRDNSTVIVRYI
jgi:serine/threonine protein phosphatase PrpC